MTDREFWTEVFLASIKGGISHEWAVKAADEAVQARNKLTPLGDPSKNKYPLDSKVNR